ncbi:MAG: hypothetical protein ABSC22_05950 [Roseiarcus sp.]|jgi:hypothetical protein
MRIADLADEAQLISREREDHAANLERAILAGHSKRPLAEVQGMRSRHAAMRAVARALRLTETWRDRLPEEFIAEIEGEP